MSLTRIQNQYDPENDIRPDGTKVSWVEYDLACEIEAVQEEMIRLRQRMMVQGSATEMYALLMLLREDLRGAHAPGRWEQIKAMRIKALNDLLGE